MTNAGPDPGDQNAGRDPGRMRRALDFLRTPSKWPLVISNFAMEPAWNIKKELLSRRPTPVQVRRKGLIWNLDPDDSVISRHIFLMGHWDRHVWEWFARRCGPWSAVLDVGANIGAFCVPLAKARPDLAVHAFEPAQQARRLLERNIADNELTNLTVYPFGLGASESTVALYRSTTNPGNASVVRAAVFDSEVQKEKIMIRRLDDLAMTNVSGVKVDVEGYEPFFLQGATRTLDENQPWFCIEYGADTVRNAGFDPSSYLADLEAQAKLLHVRRWHSKPRGNGRWVQVHALGSDQGADLFLKWKPARKA